MYMYIWSDKSRDAELEDPERQVRSGTTLAILCDMLSDEAAR